MSFPYANERFADIQMLRYEVAGFSELSLRQKTLVYYLSEATLAGRDILWDQNCRYNLPIRHMLEAVYRHLTQKAESTVTHEGQEKTSLSPSPLLPFSPSPLLPFSPSPLPHLSQAHLVCQRHPSPLWHGQVPT